MNCCSLRPRNKTGCGQFRYRKVKTAAEVLLQTLGRRTNHSRFLPAVFVATVLLTAALGAQAAEPRRLTDDGRLKLAPVFLGEGFELAYSVHDIPNRLTLMRLKLTDGSQTRMFPEIEQHLLDVTMSRNGR